MQVEKAKEFQFLVKRTHGRLHAVLLRGDIDFRRNFYAVFPDACPLIERPYAGMLGCRAPTIYQLKQVGVFGQILRAWGIPPKFLIYAQAMEEQPGIVETRAVYLLNFAGVPCAMVRWTLGEQSQVQLTENPNEAPLPLYCFSGYSFPWQRSIGITSSLI